MQQDIKNGRTNGEESELSGYQQCSRIPKTTNRGFPEGGGKESNKESLRLDIFSWCKDSLADDAKLELLPIKTFHIGFIVASIPSVWVACSDLCSIPCRLFQCHMEDLSFCRACLDQHGV